MILQPANRPVFPSYSEKQMPKLGIIAGNRAFPIHAARGAKAMGYQVTAFGIREETDPALEQEVDRMHWVALSEVGRVPELLKEEGIREILLAGQIQAQRFLKAETFDPLADSLLRLLPDRRGDSAMRMAVQFLQAQGFKVHHSGEFLKDWIPRAGVLTRRSPTPEEKIDLKAGLKLAREMSRLEIGQTVVVHRGVAVAVEATEGTDAAIRRAGEIGGAGCVVVKACGPQHDMRFDIPVVGLETIETMRQAKALCLGVEAERTLLMERPKLIALADEAGISVVAL